MIWVLNINNVIYLFGSLFGESVMCLQAINFTDKNENKFKQKRVLKYPSYLSSRACGSVSNTLLYLHKVQLLCCACKEQ